jgi:limonene-1,2-epoxide hydrolase
MSTQTIGILAHTYGRQARNLESGAFDSGIGGARAALETFYYAFNQRDLKVMERVWHAHPLAQLNNPIGGIKRGMDEIRPVYERIFGGPATVWVEFFDIAEYATEGMAVFAGRERGAYTQGGETLPLAIRTTRIFAYLGPDIGWAQQHHHGSIDDAATLARYQEGVSGPIPPPAPAPGMEAESFPNEGPCS